MVEQTRILAAKRLLAAVRAALQRLTRGFLDFSTRVYHKAGQDDIFFLAGGIAFNVMLAAIPFLLLIIAAIGFILQANVADPQQAAVDYVVRILPASERVIEFTRTAIDQVVGGRARFTVLGGLLLIWVSTRLFGSLRSALRDVFDLQEDRGIIQGKIFDAKMVVVAGMLFVGNTAITISLEAAQTYGVQLIGLSEDATIKAFQAYLAQLLAYGFIFLMFALIYRYLPARRVSWRIALVAATFTSLAFEAMKSLFAFWIANFGNVTTTYGIAATAVLLVFWIYYAAVVFILGGVVGQVYELHRIRRRQRELLD
jgi:membrane protein